MQTLNNKKINKAIQVLLIFIFIFNIAAGLYMPIIAIYLNQNILGATLATIGVSIAIYSIIKSIFQLLIAKKLDNFKGEKTDFIFLLTGILLAIIYSLGFLYIKNVNHLYVLQILTGIADAAILASYYAIFSHHIDKDSQGFEWSLFSVVGLTVSAAIGSVIGGYLANTYGFKIIFILAAIFNSIAAIILITLFPYIKNFRHEKKYKNLKIN